MLTAAILENGCHTQVYRGISGRQADSDTLAPRLSSPPCLPSPHMCSRVYSWPTVYRAAQALTVFWLRILHNIAVVCATVQVHHPVFGGLALG